MEIFLLSYLYVLPFLFFKNPFAFLLESTCAFFLANSSDVLLH